MNSLKLQPKTSFFDSLLPKLKYSLSLTLKHYLPLAGNIIWAHDEPKPKPIVKYVAGDSVSLTVAEPDANFDYLAGKNPCEAMKSHPLIPNLPTCHEKAAVLAIQVTLFPNSGFSMGIAAHHAVLDGTTTILVMKSRAYICSMLKGSSLLDSTVPELLPQLLPLYDRTVIGGPAGIDETYVKDWLKHGGPNNRSLMVWNWDHKVPSDAVRGTFELHSY